MKMAVVKLSNYPLEKFRFLDRRGYVRTYAFWKFSRNFADDVIHLLKKSEQCPKKTMGGRWKKRIDCIKTEINTFPVSGVGMGVRLSKETRRCCSPNNDKGTLVISLRFGIGFVDCGGLSVVLLVMRNIF